MIKGSKRHRALEKAITIDTSEFDGYPNRTAIMAYVFKENGKDALRLLLRKLDATLSREDLEQDAARFAMMGMPEAAAVVGEFAPEALPERQLTCPYEPTDTANHERWNAAYDRRNPS